MLPPELARSSFIQTSTLAGKSRLIRTCGVLPMVSRMLAARIEDYQGPMMPES